MSPIRLSIRPATDQRGQTLALFAIVIGLAIVPAMALLLDSGLAWGSRRTAQSAADMSALAAAVAYNGGATATSAATTAAQVSTANGYPATYSGCTGAAQTNGVVLNRPPTSGRFAGNSGYVQVTVRKAHRTTVAAALGQPCWMIEARAVARVGAVTPGGPTVLAMHSKCDKSTYHWNGKRIHVVGDVYSNGTLDMPGSGTNSGGGMYYRQGCTYFNHGNPPDLVQPSANVPADPFPYTMSDFTCQAGRIPQKLTFTVATIPTGTYCAIDSVEVNAAPGGVPVTGKVTLIAKQVVFNSRAMSLEPNEKGVLAWGTVACKSNGDSGGDAVSFKGEQAEWSGIVYAPCGDVHITAKANTTVNANIWGYRIEMGGDDWTIRGSPVGETRTPPRLSE
jgi:hypothetical protein